MIANHRVSHRLPWWSVPLVLAALAVLPGVPVRSAAAELQLEQYPRAVQQSLRAEAVDGRLLAATQGSSKGRTFYRAIVEIDGAQFDVVLGPNGRLLSKVFARVAPADEDETDDAALEDGDDDGDDKAAKGDGDDAKSSKGKFDDDDRPAAGKDDKDDRKAAGGKDDDDDKEAKGKDDDDGRDAGEKDDDDRKPGDKDDDDGKKENGKRDDDGDERDQALTLSDLPKAVRRTLKREARDGEIEDLERETENGRVIYSADVEYETDDGELVYEVEIAENGTLLHKVLEQGDDDEGGDAQADDKKDRDNDKDNPAKDKD